MARFLLSLLALVAMLAAPLGMNGAAAAAMPHHEAAGTLDHCEGMAPAKNDAGGEKASIDCMIACAALPAAASASAEEPLLLAAVPAPLPLVALAGMLPEAETPPPRTA